MPELPEMEALRALLDEQTTGRMIVRAGPAHIATLKTFDPPLRELDGRIVGSVERRGKRLLLYTADGELVLMIHLMSAGRMRLLRPGDKAPKAPAFRLELEGGLSAVLTEGGPKKRAGVWLVGRDDVEALLAHLGPEPHQLKDAQFAEILARGARRLHPLLRDQRAIAGIGRAWSNEILHRAQLSPFAVSMTLSDGERRRLLLAMNEELERGTVARTRGASDAKTYRVHGKLGEPCYVCDTPIARVDYEEHTVYYCPECQTGGRVLKDRRLSRLLR